MSKQKEEMLRWLGKVEYLTNQYARNSKEDDQKFDFLRHLIENMDKKPRVSREFVEKWAAKIYFAQRPDPFIEELSDMLTELGLEVEEKEGGDEPK